MGIAAVAVAALASACGTETVSVPSTGADAPVHHGAELFSQRCSGCHTLNQAAAHGSASNPRIAQANSGPNFNVRCERPATRVLYAIENGGFSGAIMPQNIAVGQDAIDVAKFVSTYAGRLAPKITGIRRCQTQSIGSLPVAAASASTSAPASSPTTAAAAPATPANGNGKSKGKGKAAKGKHHPRAHA
ncbi:MAG: c-type cytochrome [Solirubrobacteraceae bacterium]